MQIGDNESSTAKDFPVVSVEIREVALVQIRYCKIKGLTVQETQLLHVGDTILITPGLHSFGGFNHETAEIDTQNISGSPSRKKLTKSSFAASAIQNPLIRKILSCSNRDFENLTFARAWPAQSHRFTAPSSYLSG
jgi:two-component system phosphate regulon response regulator PhoB